ncbi:zinc transporter ZupT, putative [Acanthamoeba castellanii str. Neff]|uniref:Zinc transporter ZupT, putative n=1 Tax=Acanthamoeba castellanii (strain ATCC 30010 / Neff) TaxID=1257118 RepID=L8GLL6_ACACF|nr:zinc transporter ZupT, putative [Acanthamoeba castellanii str. Neff]ELR13932.1 zinc transporter ZupT, putative [Acanthamoeba castellanii str. Neff]
MDFTWRTQVVTLALTFVGGLATVLGGSLALLAGKPKPRKLGVMLGGSSGVMLYIAFADLIPYSALAIGHPYTWLFFVLGVVGSSLVMYYMPEPHFAGGDDNEDHGHSHGHGSREERSGCENAEARHGPTKAGLAAAIGMCIHNLPEGIAVYISCLRGLDVGLSLAVAIIIHVIPEGMAITELIYHSTGRSSLWVGKYSQVLQSATP